MKNNFENIILREKSQKMGHNTKITIFLTKISLLWDFLYVVQKQAKHHRSP